MAAADTAIVTFMEMTAKPSLHVPPPRKQMVLIRAVRPPVHFYRYLYGQLPGSLHGRRRRALDDALLADIICADNLELYVLHVDGVPAGLGEIDLEDAPSAEIAYCDLLADFMDAELRRYLLAQIVAIAWTRDISRLTGKATSLDHKGALSLYQTCGFTAYAQETVPLTDG